LIKLSDLDLFNNLRILSLPDSRLPELVNNLPSLVHLHTLEIAWLPPSDEVDGPYPRGLRIDDFLSRLPALQNLYVGAARNLPGYLLVSSSPRRRTHAVSTPLVPPVTAGAIPNLSYLSIELDHLGDGVFDSLDRITVAYLEINHAYHFSNQLDGFRDLADLIHLSQTKPFQKLSLYLAMDERFNEIEWEEDVPDEWGDNWNVEWRGEHWSDLIETPQLINLIDVCQRKRIEIKIYGSEDGEAFKEFVEWEIVGAGKNNGSRRR
jgi:hypothetical protein